MFSTASSRASSNWRCRNRQRFRGVAIIDFASSLAPDEIVSAVRKLAAKCRAVALVGPDHPTLTAAVEAMKARGHAGLLAAVRLRRRHPRRLCRPRQPQGRPHRGLDDRRRRRRSRARSRCSSAAIASTAMSCARSASAPSSASRRRTSPCWKRWSIWKPTRSPRTRCSIFSARHPDLVGCYVAGGGMEGAVAALRASEARRDAGGHLQRDQRRCRARRSPTTS